MVKHGNGTAVTMKVLNVICFKRQDFSFSIGVWNSDQNKTKIICKFHEFLG